MQILQPPDWVKPRGYANGIAARGTMQLTINRVVVREARHAIRLHGRNRNVLISDVHLYHNRGIGIFYDTVNLHQSNITGSHISYNAGGGVVVRGGDVRAFAGGEKLKNLINTA